MIKILLLIFWIKFTREEIPSIGYCVKTVKFKQDIKYLDINQESKLLFMNSNENSQMWKNKYQYPKIEESETPNEICNNELDTCLTIDSNGKLVMKPGHENDHWIINFESDKTQIKHIETNMCLESDLNQMVMLSKCENNKVNQLWSFSFIEEYCVL
jgi:adenine-specific DNA glycosylase